MPPRRTRKRGGAGYSYIPAPVDYFNKGPAELNLGQGRQFAEMHAKQHGGAGLVSGPYPTALGETLPQDLIGSARLLPLQRAFDDIKGLKDQAGGRRRRNSRKNRKNRKVSRKGRKNRKSRKNRKNRKVSRKGARKGNRKGGRRSRKGGRRSRRGGAPLGYQEVGAPGMLLTNAEYAKAGLSPEWELAKNPNAFAPLASRS